MEPALLLPAAILSFCSIAVLFFDRSRTSVAVVSTLWFLAGAATVKCAFKPGEVIECAGPTFGMCLVAFLVLFYVSYFRTMYNRIREERRFLDEVFVTLSEAHKRAGAVITGTYCGYQFEARLEGIGDVLNFYEVKVRTAPGGKPWTLRQGPDPVAATPSTWEIVAEEGLQRALAEAELVRLAESTLASDPRYKALVYYNSEEGGLTYLDFSRKIPAAGQFERHAYALVTMQSINDSVNLTDESPPSRPDERT